MKIATLSGYSMIWTATVHDTYPDNGGWYCTSDTGETTLLVCHIMHDTNVYLLTIDTKYNHHLLHQHINDSLCALWELVFFLFYHGHIGLFDKEVLISKDIECSTNKKENPNIVIG